MYRGCSGQQAGWTFWIGLSITEDLKSWEESGSDRVGRHSDFVEGYHVDGLHIIFEGRDAFLQVVGADLKEEDIYKLHLQAEEYKSKCDTD